MTQKNKVTCNCSTYSKFLESRILKYITVSGIPFSKKIKAFGGNLKLKLTEVKYTCYTHAYFWLLWDCLGINNNFQEDFQFQNISSNSQFRVNCCQVYLYLNSLLHITLQE